MTFCSREPRGDIECRVCRAQCSRKKALHLFSTSGIKENLKEKLEVILDITICMVDGLPQRICQRCARCVRGALELREKAKESQIWYRHQRNKRAKDSSGDGASPHTIHSQPPSKRALTPRRLQMEEKGKYKSDCLFRRLTLKMFSIHMHEPLDRPPVFTYPVGVSSEVELLSTLSVVPEKSCEVPPVGPGTYSIDCLYSTVVS